MNKKWFREKLLNAGLTQEKLAVSIGVRVPAITEILNKNREVSLEEAARISKCFKCSFDEFYAAYKDLTPEPAKPPAIDPLILGKALNRILSARADLNAQDLEVDIKDCQAIGVMYMKLLRESLSTHSDAKVTQIDNNS